MRLRTEIDPSGEEEIILRCKRLDEKTSAIYRYIESALSGGSEMELTLGDREFFVPQSEILFFETEDGKTVAHTATAMLYSQYKLCELETLLPATFVRVSKSCILNSALVSSITKNLTGSSMVCFKGTKKIAYVSRLYYKVLKDKIHETRIHK